MPPPPLPDGNQDEERKALRDFNDLVDGIQDAIRNASMKAPRIMFAAASNNGKNGRRVFPARYDPWVICVHASDGKGHDCGINPPTESGANFTTLGMGLELLERRWVSAGRTRQATYKKVYKSGTSFATPIAAGVTATVLDLAARVSAIEDRTKKKLKRCEEMRKVLRLMSIPKHDFGDQYCFLAPWNHWAEHWQADEAKCRTAWDSINLLFST
jgi:Subtilase family